MSIEDVLARIAGGGGSGHRGTNVLDQGDTARGGERGAGILGLLDAKTKIWLREIRASPYFRRAEEALREICNHGHDQLGALRYFRAACPERAKELEVDLWQQIDGLWDEGAPIDEFQATLDRWVQLHKEASDLFAQAIEIGDETALAAKTAWNEDVENEDLG
jgi:hypothetical protein